MQDVFIRTETGDFESWHKVFIDPTPPTREEFGIHTAGVYRDTESPNTVLLHFEVEDMARLAEYAALPSFGSASAAAGVVSRTIWIGTPQGLTGQPS